MIITLSVNIPMESIRYQVKLTISHPYHLGETIAGMILGSLFR